MSRPQKSDLDFESSSRILNLLPAASSGEPATYGQLQSAIEGLKSKDPVRVRTASNINLAAPGASLDGVTMASGDRFLAGAQTAGAENGVYVWNGAATPATRALDASTAAEVTGILVPVLEGTSANKTYRQTATGITLGTTALVFIEFGVTLPTASDTAAGIVELATTAETTTGTDATRAVTPASLAGSVHARKSFDANFGDGTSTSYVITHNLGSKDVLVGCRETGGSERGVDIEWRATSTNAVTFYPTAAPASNALRATITLAS